MKVEQAIKRALRAGYEEDRQLKLAAYVLATEYTQLRAKLPKTADGVLVVPRMTIWVIYHERRTPHQCVALAVGVERIRVEVLETRERIWVWQSACYSTRKAAEAGAGQLEEPDKV